MNNEESVEGDRLIWRGAICLSDEVKYQCLFRNAVATFKSHGGSFVPFTLFYFSRKHIISAGKGWLETVSDF